MFLKFRRTSIPDNRTMSRWGVDPQRCLDQRVYLLKAKNQRLTQERGHMRSLVPECGSPLRHRGGIRRRSSLHPVVAGGATADIPSPSAQDSHSNLRSRRSDATAQSRPKFFPIGGGTTALSSRDAYCSKQTFSGSHISSTYRSL